MFIPFPSFIPRTTTTTTNQPTMELILILTIFLLHATNAKANANNALGSPHPVLPSQCGTEPTFCASYCQTIDPSTINARCARDLVSCICTNGRGQSIGVRFVQERAPITPTLTTPAPPPPPERTFDYPPSQPLPTLLECDGGAEASSLCLEFCTMEIRGSGGGCDLADRTCRCEGVHEAVVQPAPITAYFVPRPTLPPPVQHHQFWSPITYGHPNYNPVPVQHPTFGGFYLPQPAQLPDTHTVTSEEWVTPEPVDETSTSTSITEDTKERKRRSAGSSYASVFATGPTCSPPSCTTACAKFNKEQCVPKCVEEECFCLCRPTRTPTHQNFGPDFLNLSEKVEALVASSGLDHPQPTIGLGLAQPKAPAGLTQDEYLALFAPPPTLY